MAQISITSFSNEAKFGLFCIAASPQIQPQIIGPNGDRHTGIVL